MSGSLVISRVLIVPGLATALHSALPTRPHSVQPVSIGLVIDDKAVTWGECVVEPAADSADSFTSAASIIEQKIAPLLEGRSLNDYRLLLTKLETLTETAVIPCPFPQQENPSTAISRRHFLTGNLTAGLDNPAAAKEQTTDQRPFPPGIRYSISRLLLTALAEARRVTVAELITAEYNLTTRPSPVPIHLDMDANSPMPDASLLTKPIQSLGFRVTGENPKAQLGPNGERLQRFVRQLTKLISAVAEPSYHPVIHLDVAGGLGQLFNNDVGRLLGALYGLEQAARPYPLRVVDPALADDLAEQVALTRQLIEYARVRRMDIQVAAKAHLNTLADVRTVVNAGAAHLLQLSLPRLGTVHQTMQAIQLCQEGQTAVLLSDESNMAPRFISHVALSTQPDLIMVAWGSLGRQAIDLCYSEMARTAVWINRENA